MEITLTLEQYNKIRRLSDFADFYLDDNIPSSDFYQEQYENDKEDILWAQEVFQEIDAKIRGNNG
jgi:hypothetical protein